MSQFELIEVKSESGKEYFLSGYVSTIRPDFVNDIVDEEGQKATYREIIQSDITMDEDHNEWRDPVTGKLYDGKKNKYPVAKVIEARLDPEGTWVKVKLNKHHPDFDNRILPMIKEKMLHSFSIAYKVKNYINKIINNTKYRIIKDLSIANIAITGNPINKDATFSMAFKSFPKMEEIEKTVEELNILNAELKSKIEALESENLELKSKLEDKSNKEAELKSFNDKFKSLEDSVEELKKENAELKSFVDSPQLKSIVVGKSIDPKVEQKKSVTMWDLV